MHSVLDRQRQEDCFKVSLVNKASSRPDRATSWDPVSKPTDRPKSYQKKKKKKKKLTAIVSAVFGHELGNRANLISGSSWEKSVPGRTTANWRMGIGAGSGPRGHVSISVTIHLGTCLSTLLSWDIPEDWLAALAFHWDFSASVSQTAIVSKLSNKRELKSL